MLQETKPRASGRRTAYATARWLPPEEVRHARSAEDLLHRAGARLRELFDAQRVVVWIAGDSSAPGPGHAIDDPGPETAPAPPDPATARVACDAPLRLASGELAGYPALASWLGRLHPTASVAWLSTPLRSRDLCTIGWVGLCRGAARPFAAADAVRLQATADDVTAALETVLHREARAANRLKDQFLATLSHELRTPLAAMLGWTELLKSGRLEPPQFAHALDVIERSVRVQTQLLDELLDMSRILTGRLRLDPRSIRLATVVESALAALAPTADAKRVGIERELPHEEVVVWADAARIEQVVRHLLANAIASTPAGGHVRVSVTRDGDQRVVEVRDDGQGIEPERVPMLFERFAHEPRTPGDGSTAQGLGLGLNIVRRLVELHGGAVHAASDGVGRGATFTVRLPSAELAVAGAPLQLARPCIPIDGSPITVVEP